jgi:hypothetical protein
MFAHRRTEERKLPTSVVLGEGWLEDDGQSILGPLARLLEWPLRFPPETEAGAAQWFPSGLVPSPIHPLEDRDDLATDRRIGFEREVPELVFKPLLRPLGGQVGVCVSHLQVGIFIDPNMSDDLRAVAGLSATADRVARKSNGRSPDVLDPIPLTTVGLASEEEVVSVGGDEDEEPFEADVLNACLTESLPSVPGKLGHPETVLLPELPIDSGRVLALGHDPRHVKEIPMGNIGHGQLLDEPFQGSSYATVFHTVRFAIIHSVVGTKGAEEGECLNGTLSRSL